MLREAGYIEPAYKLAVSHQMHDKCVAILLDDRKDAVAALHYIERRGGDRVRA